MNHQNRSHPFGIHNRSRLLRILIQFQHFFLWVWSSKTSISYCALNRTIRLAAFHTSWVTSQSLQPACQLQQGTHYHRCIPLLLLYEGSYLYRLDCHPQILVESQSNWKTYALCVMEIALNSACSDCILILGCSSRIWASSSLSYLKRFWGPALNSTSWNFACSPSFVHWTMLAFYWCWVFKRLLVLWFA